MLRDAFEAVAPYLSNLTEIKKFVESNANIGNEEIINLLEKKVAIEKGTLQTDYRILLNEMRKRINMEM